MNSKRIIACLDVDNGRVVKGKKFKNVQDVANPVELARQYNLDGADELVFYDITATVEKRHVFLDIIKKIAAEIDIPFMVGGGIRTLEQIDRVLQAGAKKVSINSSAIENSQLLPDAVDEFGSESITLAIDAKKVNPHQWNAFTKGGRIDTGLDVVEWAKQGEQYGVGEVVINSMDTDGVKKGFNLELNQVVANAIDSPVVASGGAGEMNHFATVLTEGMASGALAASVFHYDTIKIPELKKYLLDQHILTKELSS